MKSISFNPFPVLKTERLTLRQLSIDDDKEIFLLRSDMEANKYIDRDPCGTIEEAAEHHHPAYDEMAWDKMEKLLDKHLPQKEDKKRRFIFFLLLFLFLGGAGIIIGKPFRPGKQVARAEEATGESKSIIKLISIFN